MGKRIFSALCAFCLFALLLPAACRAHPGWADFLTVQALAPCWRLAGQLSAHLPFPAVYVLAVLLAAFFLCAAIFKKWRLIPAAFCVMASVFLAGWGVCCQRPALHLPAQTPAADLRALCLSLAAEAEANVCDPPENILILVPAAMDALAAQGLPIPTGFAPPRASRMPALFSRLLLEGIFIPFTGEALVNESLPACCLPFVACHEAAHARGFAAEQDANLLAYLACAASEEPFFRFSGAVCALSYALEALRETDFSAYAQVCETLTPAVRDALGARHAFWTPYRGKPAAAVAASVNESYLASVGAQHEGLSAYGGFVDSLLGTR